MYLIEEMADTIKHQGVVESIEGKHIRVRITQTSACASCDIKGYCSSADTKEKIIDIYLPQNNTFAVGDNVWVVGHMTMGLLAVLCAFLLPLIILVISLFLLMYILNDEFLSACLSIVLVAFYYIVLKMLFKGPWKEKLTFTIQRY